MSNLTALETCDCPRDCNSNQYSYSISSTKLDPDVMCKQFKTFFSDPRHVGPPKLMRNFENVLLDLEAGSDDVCRRTLEKVAFVYFQLAGQTVMQFKKELRVTLADQISNFGERKCSELRILVKMVS